MSKSMKKLLIKTEGRRGNETVIHAQIRHRVEGMVRQQVWREVWNKVLNQLYWGVSEKLMEAIERDFDE